VIRALAASCIFVGFLLPADASRGEDILRLDELVSAIRQRNPSRAAAVTRIEAARLQIARARALPDPFAQAMVEDIPPNFRGAMPMVRLQASQMLPWFGKRERMAAVAAREADAVAARADTVALDVVTEGRRMFHQLVLNRAARQVNREQRAIVATLVEVATGRLRAGTGMHHDVLKMQTEASMVDDALVMLVADRREMAAMVNALLDRPAETPVAEPAETWTAEFALDRARATERAIASRPELREMSAMRAAELAMAAAARREYYPDVMVGALYDIRVEGQDGMGAMLGLNVPIWIGSKQRLDVHAAEARASAVDRDRAAMAAMVRAEVERQLARIEATEQRIALLEREFLPRAQQTFDSAMAAFPSGTVDVLQLLDALRTLENQRLARVGLRVARELAITDLERATGSPVKEMQR
jgi:outer membrane protein TolC